MTDTWNKNFSCSELSLKSNEELFGTAPRVDVWFLLEYRGAWSDNTFVSSKISENVKRRIDECLESIPNSRLQLIKRQNDSEGKLKFYLAKSDELDPKLFEFDLSDYEEILDLDVDEMLSGESNLRGRALFLICTNGAHDKCCGKYGVPVYLEAVKREDGFMIWQCTHLGGHRFAANVLFMPYGIYYGRVDLGSVSELIEDAKNRHIRIENYRGRCCYSREVQAAEYFLRDNTGISDLNSIRFNGAKRSGSDISVEFHSVTDEIVYQIQVQEDKDSLMTLTSCKDEEKSLVTQYRFVEFKRL